MKNYLLGVDLGTTNVKAMLFTQEGEPVARGEAGHYKIHSPHFNWAEQDASVWWTDTVQAIRQISQKNPWRDGRLAGISVSSQGMAMLPLDQEGNPLTLAHIWMDRRGTREAQILEEVFGRERIKECFGAYADPYYQITNILWFKRNQPELYKRTRYIVKANTYLNYKLTGEMALDEGQAEMTLCYDIRKRQWSRELGEKIGIPLQDILPRVAGAHEILGTVTPKAALETGLPQGTPVVVGGVDSALALLEVGITRQGDGAEITGTSSNNFFASPSLPPKDSALLSFTPLVRTKQVPHLLFGPTNATGEALRWFSEILGVKGSAKRNVYEELEQLGAKAAAGSSGILFYPYLMGERAPLWSNTMRGMFMGASIRSTREDFVRSVYEGTSFALKDICREAEDTGIQIKRFRVAGGCAKSDLWLKIKASMLDLPIYAAINSGGAPRGNAILAGYGTGLYEDFEKTAEEMIHFDKIVEPDPQWTRVYQELFPVYRSIRESVKEDLNSLAQAAGKYE